MTDKKTPAEDAPVTSGRADLTGEGRAILRKRYKNAQARALDAKNRVAVLLAKADAGDLKPSEMQRVIEEALLEVERSQRRVETLRSVASIFSNKEDLLSRKKRTPKKPEPEPKGKQATTPVRRPSSIDRKESQEELRLSRAVKARIRQGQADAKEEEVVVAKKETTEKAANQSVRRTRART